MITGRPSAKPQKPTRDEKRLSYYLKSVEKHIFYPLFHHGANQFCEMEMETAWDYSF